MKFDNSFFRDKLKEKEISTRDLVYELARLGCKVSAQAIENWKMGRTSPSSDKLLMVSQVLGMNMEEWFLVEEGKIVEEEGE